MQGRRLHPNRLLVEGEEDKRVIPHLIEAHGIRWGERKEAPVVHIKTASGVENLLRDGKISTEIAARGVRRLGILLDANSDIGARWQRIYAECAAAFPELPRTPPPEGAVTRNHEGKFLGIWLMPDNRSRGMLETFLAYLVPDGGDHLWSHACEAVTEARSRGAPCRDAHHDKARLHTWLAWQNPPGRQLHNALIERILDPRSPHAAAFVAWFRRLYAL